MAKELRERLDQHGAKERALIIAGDGSFCNRSVFRSDQRGVIWLSRARRNSRLCFPAPAGSRRIYDQRSFTPEDVRQDESIEWQKAAVFYGAQYREIRYKEVKGACWRKGSGRRPLRILVVAPQPYYHCPGGKTLYRAAAYLFCTDLELSAQLLLQSYLDRWQIEVNHREMKDIFGVGDAQVRNQQSVKRHPAFAVAAYSALLIAAMQAFGPRWNPQLFELPRWRKRIPNRPSAYDLLARLRRELNESTQLAGDLAEIRGNLPLYAYG
jgi:Transposase DDE domain